MSSRHTVSITIEADGGNASRVVRGVGDDFEQTARKVEQAGGQVSRGMDQTTQSTGRLNAAITGAVAGLGAMAGNAALGAAQRGFDIFVTQVGQSINAASDLEESMAKTGEVFRDQTDAVVAWSEGSAQAFGQSKQDALEAASTFGNLFTAMGLATDQSAMMSTEIVELAADLASFNNIEIAEAVTALRAGMVGETEPMRRLGVQLSAAAVEAKALEMGLGDLNGELTEAEKVQARYQIILDQTTTAQGDFERTSDGLANQQRIQQAQWEDLQATIGTGLLPVMAELLQVSNDIAGSDAFQSALLNIAQGMERWTAAAVFTVETTGDLVAIMDDLTGVSQQVSLGMGFAAEGAGFFADRIGDVSDLAGDAKGVLQELSIVAQDPNWADGFLEWLNAIDLRGGVVKQKTEEINEQIERSKQIQIEVRAEEVKRAAIQAALQAQLVASNAEFEKQIQHLTESTVAGNAYDAMMLDSIESLTSQEDILHSAREAMDEATRTAMRLGMAHEGLAGAYQHALDVMSAFNSQSSEYASTQGAIEKAVEAVQKKQEQGIPLSEKEIVLLEDHEEALGRVVGGQQDATIEAGIAAIAAGELMIAQDELNDAINNNVEDLEPYKQAVADAEEKLGLMGSTTGETQDAQGALVDTINGPLIGAIQELTRNVEYIAKPWLMEIDAATGAAEAEIARLKAMIESGAVLPISITTGGIGGGEAFADGGISRGGMALVGEEGPELVFLPRGSEVMSNPDSKRFLGAFAGGTGGAVGINAPSLSGGSLGSGGGFNADAFVDIGMTIGDAMAEGISIALEAGLIEESEITGAEMAEAMITGAIMKIEAEGEGAIDQWRVNLDRIPEIASHIGNETIVALLDEFQRLEDELVLAEIAGQDLEEIGAQLDAIEAIFAAWAGDTVASVEEVWDAVTDAARAEEAKALFESLFGAISLPGPTLSFDLEDLISGDAEKDLQEAGDELWALYDLYVAAGMDEAAAKVLERIAELDLQDDFIDGVLGTDTAQAMMDQYAAQVEAADAEEAQKAAAEKVADIWETVLSTPIEELASGDFIAEQQAILDGLYDDLSIAEALGLEDHAAEIRAAIEEQEFLLYAAGEAMATPVVEAAAEALAEIPQISADTLDDLAEIFGEYPEVAEGMIDDLIQAVVDGRLPFEDAMHLIAMAPEEDLIPALEELEEQLTVDLAQALLDFGPDSPEVQAILASLGMIEDAALAAGAATSTLTDEQLALQASLGNAPGEDDPVEAFAGGGSGEGGTGFLAGPVVIPEDVFGPGPYSNAFLYEQSLLQNPGPGMSGGGGKSGGTTINNSFHITGSDPKQVAQEVVTILDQQYANG